jgi:chaperonin cofactor prefoldin
MSDENRIALGETFVAVDTDQADAFLERKETELKRDRDALRQELTVVTDRMTKLKGQLYAKFGKSINLEEN